MKFRTNAKCMGCVSAMMPALKALDSADVWNFDLSSPDKTLSYSGAESSDDFAAKIVEAITKAGFKAERL